MLTRVLDLRTGTYASSYTCTPRDAVIAAFAQHDRRDFNTWDYEKRYGSSVEHGRHTVTCGDFTALSS